jgi:DNA-directed RNA polymerase subunit RPC12/RpoP
LFSNLYPGIVHSHILLLRLGPGSSSKYNEDRNRWTPKDTGVPISLPNYEQIDSRKEFYCPYCQLRLSKLIDSSGQNTSYYCSKCTIEYPDQSEVKSKSSLSTPRKSNNDNPLASTKFKEPTVGKEPTEIKGGLAELMERFLAN